MQLFILLIFLCFMSSFVLNLLFFGDFDAKNPAVMELVPASQADIKRFWTQVQPADLVSFISTIYHVHLSSFPSTRLNFVSCGLQVNNNNNSICSRMFLNFYACPLEKRALTLCVVQHPISLLLMAGSVSTP